MAAVAIRGVRYPVVLPKLRDPRLHLAATITSLQVLGQVAFQFRLSIAQILITLVTAAVLEVAIALRRQHVLLWPASALLTANGVAFVLRVPGTRHGDWWSLRAWWLYMAVGAVSLLSKHVIRFRGEHVFNPSNFGLVLCFVALGRTRAEPLDFWWGPMSWWMGVALAIIVTGGFTILRRLSLLRVALAFWGSFAASLAVVAWRGHVMTARWHLGPIVGFHFWWILVTSPEVLVFLFFMITDPKTAPTGGRARVVYGVVLGLLAALMIGPTRTEFAAKVALLAALAIVCAARPLLALVPRRRLVLATIAAAASYPVALFVLGNGPGAATASATVPHGWLPPITIQPSPHVQTKLDLRTARVIAHGLLARVPAHLGDRLAIHLEPGRGQGGPVAVVQLAGHTYRLASSGTQWSLQAPSTTSQPVRVAAAGGLELSDVARQVGLDFRQGSFRFGVSPESQAMMGGGVCWLDYNGDGWEDLYAVNSYASSDAARWEAHGGLPRSTLFENDHGRFRDVGAQTHTDLAVQGDGCVAADLDGDGRTDLVVTTTTGIDVLWNLGGAFRTVALPQHGWYTGAAVADVNGDGRPDLFVAGYSDPNQQIANSFAGFPTNVAGVRDLLFLNDGGRRFREVGVAAGLESASFRHGLGAEFVDVNGDGRPDLLVANDEDPNQLYVDVPWPGGAAADPAHLGFRFEDRAAAAGVADPFAGMGIAAADGRLVVTNSRGEPSAAYRATAAARYADDRANVDGALGTGFAGWGASFVDLLNSARPDLVLTAGAIPVTDLARDAEPVRVLAPNKAGLDAAAQVPGAPTLNGRGLAVADAANDGRETIAINTIGGNLVLLRAPASRGHWLDVELSRFAPGAVVSVVLPDGRRFVRAVTAGSSYLSSEDPRLHFGLGGAVQVAQLVVRQPSGAEVRLAHVPVDRVLRVTLTAAPPNARAASDSATIAGCTPARDRRSIARIWNDTAIEVLRSGGAAEPVQARDLYDLSVAIGVAYRTARPSDREAAVSFAAYRLLLWQASYDANLVKTFAILTNRLRSLCFAPGFVATAGGGAAVGNRVAAAAVARDRRDGSHEGLHFADPSYVPQNQPLVVAQPVSTVHDATFWQPLALSQVSPRGSAAVPAAVQTFLGSQWGAVRTFAGKVRVPAPRLGYPTGKVYRAAALSAISATAAPFVPPRVDPTPVGWNALLDSLPRRGLAFDVRLDLALNAALNDAAVSAFGAKREYQSPRPISMIRYLAFNGQLPIVAGLTRSARNGVEVRSNGRWLAGDRWVPPVPTPASPGWPSADAAFASAASRVLRSLTGRSFARRADAASSAAVHEGVELATDAAAGRQLGAAVARRVLARLAG